ncbi:MAG: hypothetical protein FWD68_09955 [Alphaproteobacteria bacterium]|nr:hypothetical protein [Alphaproteobacteria bacterium]
MISLCLDLGDEAIDDRPELYTAIAQAVTDFAASLPLPQRRETEIRWHVLRPVQVTPEVISELPWHHGT